MASRGAASNNGNENLGWPHRLPSTEPMAIRTSRKRPYGDASPGSDSDSTVDNRSRRFSVASEFRGVRDRYVPSMGRHHVTMRPINTNAEEVNTRGTSVTAKAEFEGDDVDHDTGGSPQTPPSRFRDALTRLKDELHSLDSFFFRRDRDEARQHVDDIKAQLDIMEESRRTLYSDFCNQQQQMEELRNQLSQLKDQTEAATLERDEANRELEDLKTTTARLQLSIEEFERDRMELDNPITDLEDRNERLKAENEKLQAVVGAKDAEIEALKTSPLCAASSASIEHETSDSLPQVLSLSVPPAPTTPVAADAGERHTQYKYDRLRLGIASFLSNLLEIDLAHDQPVDGTRLNSVVTEFMFNLGRLPDTADVAVPPAEGFWKLRPSWTSRPVTSMDLQSCIEGQFAQLCLLIPHLKSRSQADIWQTTFRLTNSLMKADHSSVPRAGKAFLAAMKSTNLVTEVQNLDNRNAVLAIALCELCRFLQETFAELPQATWDIGNILGPEAAQSSVIASPIRTLGACLANLHRSDTVALRRQLATACDKKFCFHSVDEPSGDKTELGFLSCDDNETFLQLNFRAKSIRFVDRNLAYVHQEDQKKHLLIRRPDEEDALLDMEDAAHDVRIFWAKFAESPWFYGKGQWGVKE